MAGLNLVYHPRLESIGEHLATDFNDRVGDPASLFEPAWLVVPNRSIQTYLQQELSRHLGVTPNLRFALLRRFLTDALPDTGDERSVEILGHRQLHHLLIDLLGTELESPTWLVDCPEVAEYLTRPDDPEGRDRRLFQLSQQLSQLFIEYAFSRDVPVDGTSLDETPLLRRWRRIGADGSDQLDGVEKWQQIIWWQIFGEDGVLDDIEADTNQRYLTLADAFRRASSEDLRAPDDFHVVGFAYVARLFIEAMHLLSHRSTVNVHALCPTADWVENPPEDLADDDCHLLLQQWGTAGADHAVMWNRVADDVDYRDSDVDAAHDNLLDALQRDIATGDSPPSDEPTTEGVRFFECHSVKREAEAVANEIWTMLRSSDDLRPDDIAVLIAGDDQQQYQTHLEAVFQSFENLPRTIVELPAGSTSRVLEATQLLLELPFGRFTRRELLRILVHPNTAGRGGDVDTEQWKDWCRRLNILYAADRDEQSDTYLGESCTIADSDYEWDVYNWDQGMRRLALGAFLSGQKSGINKLFEVDGRHYQPLEVTSGELTEASRFIQLAGSLIGDARWLVDGGEQPRREAPEDWGEQLAAYIETYLTCTDAKDDAYEYSAVLRIIRDVAQSCPVDTEISYRVFYEFVRDELDQLQRSRGSRLTDGVVISSALSMRAIPFEHVFVVGLGEGQFPNPERTDSLDLRQRDEDYPKLGDLKPADRDRYTFLEILLAARHSITLSWVGRDATTGEPLEASSVVNQLRWALEDRFDIPAESDEALTVHHPLRRFDHRYFPALFEQPSSPSDSSIPTPSLHEEARNEATLRTLRDTLTSADTDGRRRKLPPLDEMRRDLAETAPDTWEKLRQHLKLPAIQNQTPAEPDGQRIEVSEPDDEPETPEPRRVRLTLSKLRKFLESPLQGAARVQLGLRDDEDDLFGEDYGVVKAGRMERAIALREVANEALRRNLSKDELPALFDKSLFPEVALQNRLPCGHFLLHDRKSHLQTLKTWWDNFDKYDIEPPLIQIGIGREAPEVPGETIDAKQYFDPVEFTLTPNEHGVDELTEVEIVGITEPTHPERNLYVTFAEKTRQNPSSKRRERYFLRSYVSWIVATAAGRPHADDVRIVLNTMYASTSAHVMARFIRRVPDWDQPTALDYLEKLTASLLTDSHDYLLPVEILAELPDDIEDKTDAELQDTLRDALESPMGSDRYGPIDDLDRFGPPEDLNIAETLRRRFPYLFGGNQ